MRSWRTLLADLRVPREDDAAELRAEQCLEALFEPGACACANLGEREEAELEAERRRWSAQGAGRPAAR
jgi:hypothetical protein